MSIRRASWMLALVILMAAPTALAQTTAAEPTTSPADTIERPVRIGLGVGLGVGGGISFLITEEVDYRFLPSELGSMFVGLALGEGIGNAFLFQAGVRAGYDFRLFRSEDLEVLVAPQIVLGAAFADVQGLAAWFDLQIGVEGRVVLLDGLLAIFLRPLAFDFFIAENTFVRYDLVAGASVQF